MKQIYFFKNDSHYLLFCLFIGLFSPVPGFAGTESPRSMYLNAVVAPVVEDQSFSIVEGSASGTNVGTISATAEGGITDYSILSATFYKDSNPPRGDSFQDPEYNAMSVFSLNAETGLLSVDNPKYLLSGLGPIVLEVEITDASGEKASSSITINITEMEVTITETLALDWETVANHPQGHSEATGGVINEKLFVFGGFTSKFAPKASVFTLDANANSWSRLADMPPMASNSGGGGATHMGWTDDGTDIYIAAGYAADASGNAQQFGARRVYKYIVAEDRYEELPSLPIDRSAGALEFIADKLYYVAGTNRARTEDQGDLLVLDLNDLSSGWSYLSAMPNPRNHIGSAVFNGQLYVFGGQKEHDEELVPQDDVHRYDPETNTWTQLSDMPQPLNHIHASVFVYGDYIYSIGGQIVHNATPYASVYAYHPETNTWKQFTDLPARRFSIVGGGIDGKLYASGGNNSRTTYLAALPESILGLENVQNGRKNGPESIKIYPNPAKNSLFISRKDRDLELSAIAIYDMNGKKLEDFAIERNRAEYNYQLPISQFSAGFYMLKLTTTSGAIITKRLLIQ
ncbi:kelch repeat-containing protein [Flavimarina sp. Hel_I_48]|uniref:Kelch repeat-containing protein n=1 Tax=Flavimarina sp. Hel_I_48 TaxID=1392488 RepID=UPI0013DD7BC2|nr:kelch repeat-containing protein [Flavimarina sp. Hel_I_48]